MQGEIDLICAAINNNQIVAFRSTCGLQQFKLSLLALC